MPDPNRFVLFVRVVTTGRGPAGVRPPRILKDGTPVSWAELVLGSSLILLALLGTWYVLRVRSDALALRRDPVTVEGKVLALWTTTGKGAARHVRYEYAAAGDCGPRVWQREATLPEKEYARLEVGGPIAITYCRTNPTCHRIEGAAPAPFAEGWLVVAAAVMLALLAGAGFINLWAWWVARPAGPAPPRTDQGLRESLG